MNKFKETKMLGFSVPFFLIMVVVFIAISMTGSMLGSFVGALGFALILSQYRYKRIGNVSCNPSGEHGYSE